MHDIGIWLPPVLVATFLGAIGWLLTNAVGAIVARIQSLEAMFLRVTAELAADHRAAEIRMDSFDRRLTRVESWKEMMTLPDPHGRNRRSTDSPENDT